MADLFFDLKLGDTRPELAISIIDEETSAPLSLVGATAKFTMREDGGAIKVNEAIATVYDAVNGKVKYTWQAADVDTVGTYLAEFEITLSGGGLVTFPQNSYIKVRIMEDLP